MLRIIPKLGYGNTCRVILYRVLLRLGYYRWRLPIGSAYFGPFFIVGDNRDPVHQVTLSSDASRPADRVLAGELPFYGHEWRQFNSPLAWPDKSDRAHWSCVNEFSHGDIKDVWEPSRFAGLLLLAHATATGGEKRHAEACEAWLTSWVSAHPWNIGRAWKCAQETALRLMATILAADMLERHARMRPAPAMFRFIREHARRIGPTMLYAVAQDNNHATSEAAALYVAGAFLSAHGESDAEARKWLHEGRQGIEARLRRLVLPDGSFAQHSVTYHRLLLDTMVMGELWRRRIDASPWTKTARHRLGLAAAWLERLVDPISGDAPNLGANDGARFFAHDRVPYRDFRTSADLATRLFLGRRARLDGVDPSLALSLGLEDAPNAPPLDLQESLEVLPKGGYAIWKFVDGCMLLRLPYFRFRPSHCDMLHVNLHWRGIDVLRDGGSFSYNSIPDRSGYYAGVESHNTVQFDGRDQMPRLSRFLWGFWPRGRWMKTGPASLSTSYKDWLGARHARHVSLVESQIRIDDEVSGFTEKAVLRWHLPVGQWHLDQERITNGTISLTINGGPDLRIRLIDGEESRHYQSTTPICVVEAGTHMSGRISTVISWS